MCLCDNCGEYTARLDKTHMRCAVVNCGHQNLELGSQHVSAVVRWTD